MARPTGDTWIWGTILKISDTGCRIIFIFDIFKSGKLPPGGAKPQPESGQPDIM